MKTCRVGDLFSVDYGVNLELNALELDENGINFVSRTSKNNGVSAKVKRINEIEPLPAGTITVASGGSVMETFLQMSPYYSGRDLYCLTPKVKMSNEVKLFYCCCLRLNKYKFSYGRQANVTLSDLLIPDLDSIPSYVHTMSIKKCGEELIRKAELKTDSPNYPACKRTVLLNQLFRVENGIASSQVVRSKRRESHNWVPYIRPSYRQETSIDAYVNKKLVPSGDPVKFCVIDEV